MFKGTALALVLICASFPGPAVGQQQESQSTQCLTTLAPNPPFVPPAPNFSASPDSQFWYGSDALWTALQYDGKWPAFGKEEDGWVYRTKLVFWHRGFDWRKESEPKLIVTGKRLDGDAPTVAVAHANAVFLPTREDAGIMTLIDIPKAGCWEITAHYKGHDLSFVVSVEPQTRH
jgi:hypothetical protein